MDKQQADFITEKQTTIKLGISRATLRRLVDSREFAPRYHLSPGRVAFRAAEVDAWAESRRERMTEALA